MAKSISRPLAVFAVMVAVLPLPAAMSRNVRDFGAVGDGVHDDTLAIQKAADALYPGRENKSVRDHILLARGEFGRGGKCDGATGELYFPKGVYRVTGPVKFFWCVNLRGEEGTVVRNDTRDQDTFYFHFGFRVRIDSIAFEGGYIQVRQWTRNISDALLFVSGCTFRDAAGTALVSDSWRIDDGKQTDYSTQKGCPPYEISTAKDGRAVLRRRDPSTLRGWPNSTEILVENCRFEGNFCAFDLSSDGVFVRDCDIFANASSTGAAARVGTTAHLGRVRFSTERNASAPGQCALQCGRETILTDCSFASRGAVAALSTTVRACGTGNIASHIALKDVSFDTGDAPVMRLGKGAMPNMFVADGLTARNAPGAASKKLLCFESEPSAEEVRAWPAENAKGRHWPHPVIDVRKCLGICVENVSREFDVSLPAALEPFRRKVARGVRRHGAIRLSPVGRYGAEIADAQLGGDEYDGTGRDDTDRLRALFAKAAAMGDATVVLPPKWMRLRGTVDIPKRVHVVARGQAVITADDGAPAFRLHEGADALFENVTFHLGRNAVECVGGSGRLRFRACALCAQKEAAVLAEHDGPSRWRIELTGGVVSTPFFYRGNAAPFLVDGTWHTVGPETPLGQPHKKSFAAVVNLPGGVFEAQDVIGVPRYFDDVEVRTKTGRDPSLKGDYRWIDNYGTMRLSQYRFGGERGGLSPLYHYEGASSYVEGGFASHCNNWRLRHSKASAVAFCDSPDLAFVDVVGFLFVDEPPFVVLRQREGGVEALTGCAHNCYPYPRGKGAGLD